MADTETVAAQAHTYKFNVKMTCAGCSGAVTRALNKAQENNQGQIDEFSVDLPTETVIVKGKMPYEEVLEKIKKTGKEVRSGETVD